MKTIDLSLKNTALYEGCEIVEEAGRLTLKTPPAKAIGHIGRNLQDMDLGGEAVTLTGPMAVFAYLVVFRHVANRFQKVYYHDGRSEPLLIASNG